MLTLFIAAIALASQAQEIVNEDYLARNVSVEFLRKEALQKNVPHGLAIRLDREGRRLRLSGQKKDVAAMAHRLRTLDVEPVALLVELELVHGPTVVARPKIRTLDGMGAAITLPDCIEGEELTATVVLRKGTAILTGDVTLLYRDTLYTLPFPATADCAFSIEKDSDGVRVSRSRAASMEHARVSSEWMVLAGRKLKVKISRAQ